MNPHTQAFIFTILIMLLLIPVELFFIMGMAVDPYSTYTDRHAIMVIIIVATPFLIMWLIGIAIIYIVAYSQT